MGSPGWPAVIRPMLAVAGELPVDPGWAYEFKWDGVRAVGYVNRSGRLRLLSRNDRDITGSYPELAVAAPSLAGRAAVLDGELVTLDRRGVPSFSALQRRMHVRSPGPSLIASAPVRYLVFDLLYLGGPLIGRPWSERRAALEQLELNDARLTVPEVFDRDGPAVMRAAKRGGLEGVVAKRVDAGYQPGRRSPDWCKTALIQTTEVIIAGYKPGTGRRAGAIGSLLLAGHEPDGELGYLGAVGTGFTSAMLDELGQRLRPLHRDRSPFPAPLPAADAKGACWVEPVLVGEVVYRTVTPDGRLRHSAWRGLRPDREPGEVVRPEPG